jgi:hypothetical protein
MLKLSGAFLQLSVLNVLKMAHSITVKWPTELIFREDKTTGKNWKRKDGVEHRWLLRVVLLHSAPIQSPPFLDWPPSFLTRLPVAYTIGYWPVDYATNPHAHGASWRTAACSSGRTGRTICVRPSGILLLLWLYSSLFGLGHFFSFLILYTVGRTPWTVDRAVARPLPTHKTTQTQNKCTQYRQPCLVWDSNPRFQCSSERRQFMP